jgi:uncharacterized protein (TIGR02231 family)
MKNFITALLLLCTVHVTAQDAKTIESKITDVTVFMSGAELHHQASIPIKEGKQTIVFGDLSPDINERSIVIDIEQQEVKILSVNQRINYLNNATANKNIKNLQDSLDQCYIKMDKLKKKITVYQNEAGLLFKNEAIGGTTHNVPTLEIEKAANFYRARMLELIEISDKLESEYDVQSSLSLRLNAQLNEMNAKFNPPSTEITVVVECSKVLKADFSIKYQVFNAGWVPQYDVRSAGITAPVELTYRANVYNSCGLDWNNVRLKLSTADPKQGAEKPTLNTWDLANTTINDKWTYHGDMEEQLQNKNTEYTNQKALGKGLTGTKQGTIELVEVAELSAEFAIPQPYTIIADAKPYIVEVTQYNLPATYEHYAVPKLDTDAFLTARIVGWADLNLVSGEANVYYSGAYIGNSYINTNSVEDTLVLSLGRDSKIKISRIKKSEESKKSTLGGTTKDTQVFEIVVKNNREGSINVTIVDQIPISSDTEIEVTANEISDATLEKNTGKLTWQLKVAAGESKKLLIDYTIKSPTYRKISRQSVYRSRAKF